MNKVKFRIVVFGFVGLTIAALPFTALGQSAKTKVQAGRDIAQEYCARCHGIGRMDDSPLEQAPPFRRLHDRYPIEELAEAFAEGIVVGHTEMPPFAFDPPQIDALLAYLKSLERGPRR